MVSQVMGNVFYQFLYFIKIFWKVGLPACDLRKLQQVFLRLL
jgi:hypothetical protein